MKDRFSGEYNLHYPNDDCFKKNTMWEGAKRKLDPWVQNFFRAQKRELVRIAIAELVHRQKNSPKVVLGLLGQKEFNASFFTPKTILVATGFREWAERPIPDLKVSLLHGVTVEREGFNEYIWSRRFPVIGSILISGEVISLPNGQKDLKVSPIGRSIKTSNWTHTRRLDINNNNQRVLRDEFRYIRSLELLTA